MDATALRAMQAPIKERYKGDPGAAMITLKAKGTLDDQNIACKVETGRALAVAGLHPATGGSGLELCSGDMLLEALVACAGVTLEGGVDRARHSAQVRHVSAEGDLDFRGTLGVAKDAPVGFAQIRLTFDGRHRRAAGEARSAVEAHRALLRGVSDDQERPAGRGQPQACVIAALSPSPVAAEVASAASLDRVATLQSATPSRVAGGEPAAMTTGAHVPRPLLSPRPRAAHGGHGGVRDRGLDHHRALRPGDRRAGRDAAGFGRAVLPFPRARPRRGLHRAGRAREPADERRDHPDVPRLRASRAAPRPASSVSRPASRSGSSFAALARAYEWTLAGGILLNVVALGALPAAGAALPRRQDAADHAALVRHSAARRARRDAGRDRGDAVEHRRSAVSGMLALFPAVFTSLILILHAAHRRPRDRRRAGERPMGADRVRHRDRRVAPDRAAARLARRRSASRSRPASTWNLGLWFYGRRKRTKAA